MAYIGAVAPGYDPTRASVPQLDAERFNGNASTTAFTLTRQVVSPTDINVIVENVLQEPTIAYSVDGYTLNFTEAPPTGTNNIYVVYRGSGISNYAFVPDGSITFAKLANNIKQFTVDTFTANGTGSTIELTEAPASANAVIVSVDGVIQTAPTNYTLSGSTITFTGVPDNGANVVVKHIGFRTTSTVTALQAGSVTATELADGSVTNVKLAGSITSDKITSVSNTAITGNIVSSQITSVSNTQITGTITASQIAAVNASTVTTGTLPSARLGSDVMVSGNMPAFYAYNATTQSIGSGTYTKVQFPTEGFDTANCYDNATNYRFTPNVAGYYQLNAGVYFASSGSIILPLYKNGSLFMESNRLNTGSAGNTLGFGGLVYANGSSDYFEIYAYASSGSTLGSNLALFFWFTGVLVRAA